MFGNTFNAKGQRSPHVLLRYWSIKPHIIPLLTASSPLNTIQKEFKKLFSVAFTHVLHFPFSFLDDYTWNSSQD